MKIKKYIAESFQTGKAQIISELGEEAVILSSRSTKKPDGNSSVEIVAAIDEKELQKKNAKKASRPVQEKFAGLDQLLQAARQEAKVNDQSNRVQNYTDPKDVYDEIFSIKNQLVDINEKLKYKYAPSMGETFGDLYKELIDNDISEEEALEITGKISSEHLYVTLSEARAEARHILIKDLKINNPLQKKDKRQVAVFCGISGGGKTMSLIKTAIITKLVFGSNILIVSADTYKVGGAEQLQTYSSIAGIQFKNAYSLKDLRKIISEEDAFDFIFVDTTGISHNNNQKMGEISDVIKACKADRVFLVQPITMNRKTFKNVLENFLNLGPTDVILSKLDDYVCMGGISSVLNEFSLPVTYLSFGQKVPEDIEPADKKVLGRLILPEEDFDGNIRDLFKQ